MSIWGRLASNSCFEEKVGFARRSRHSALNIVLDVNLRSALLVLGLCMSGMTEFTYETE